MNRFGRAGPLTIIAARSPAVAACSSSAGPPGPATARNRHGTRPVLLDCPDVSALFSGSGPTQEVLS
jgi:hypothetical protein